MEGVLQYWQSVIQRDLRQPGETASQSLDISKHPCLIDSLVMHDSLHKAYSSSCQCYSCWAHIQQPTIFSLTNCLLANSYVCCVNMLQAAPKLEDFPALGGRAAAATAGPSTSQPPSDQPSSSTAAADGAAAAGTGVSDALKAANKASIYISTALLARCYPTHHCCQC